MADFRINVIIDPRGAAAGTTRVKRELTGIRTQAQRVGRVLATAFAFAGLTLGIGQLVQLGDEFTNIQNRIRVVTDTTDELTQATDELFDIAQRTRSAFGATVEVYSRVALAARDLGISQRETLQFTESLNQAVILSGASAQEAQAGLIQLSQGLASGALRGDELRSVLEQLPVVSDIIAQSLGVTRGELRTLGAEGKITAEIVLDAFAEAREELEDRFGQTVPTISQAFGVLRNSLISFVGQLATTQGATSGLANFIIDLSGTIDQLALVFTGALDPTTELSDGVKTFSATVLIAARIVTGFAQSVGTVLTTSFKSAGQAIGGTVAGIEQFLRGDTEAAATIFAELGNDLTTNAANAFTDLRETLALDTIDTIEQLVNIWDEGSRQIQEAQADALGGGGERTSRVPAIDPDVLEDQQEFIEGLQRQAAELAIQTALLDEADATLLRYNTAIDAAKLGNEEFQNQALAAAEAVIQQQEALQAAETAAAQREADTELVESLREQLRLLQLTREERAVAAELAELSALATGEQRAEVEALSAEIFRLQEIESQQKIFLDEFIRDTARTARDTLSGALSDPLGEGFEQLPAKFAGTLQNLASEFLASEIFKLLSGIGGGGGGILGAVGSFFGQGIGLPGFQGGGGFRVGGAGGPDSQLVAFKASPMENVTISPPGAPAAPQAAPQVNVSAPPVIVVDSEEKAMAAIQSARGEEATLAHLRNNPEAVRQIIGA